MPWVRFDDQYPIHRKVDGLSDAAFRLHTSAIFWSARNLTDGFVSREDLDGVSARVRTPERFAAECVKRDVWHDARWPCPSEKCPGPVDGDGWIIHDYWEFQFTKEQVLQQREANRHRQKQYRANHNGSSNGVTEAVTKSTPSRPVISVVDVVNQAPRRNARGDPVIDEIIKAIYAATSRVIDETWARKIADHILGNHHAANPAAYVRAVIENDPDPRTRFLEH